MLFRIMLLGYFLISIVACDFSSSNHSGDTGLKKDSLNTDTLKKDLPKDAINHTVNTGCDTTVNLNTSFSHRDDKFISNALDNELTCKYIDKVFKGIDRKIKLSKNKYSAELSDTVATYKVDCDSVAYLSTKDNCFPLYLTIQSDRMAFDKGIIKVGMEKEKFAEKFGLKKQTSDVIKITETEAGNEMIFVFKNNKLTRIIYNNLFVD